MSHVDKGMVKATGEYKVLLQEFALLVGGMRSAGVKDEDIKEAFKVGFMSEEELDNAIKEQKEKLDERFKSVDKAIDELAEKIVEEILSDGREEP